MKELLLALAAVPRMSVDLSVSDGVLHRIISIDECPSRSFSIPFDPAFMAVELDTAWTAGPGGASPVPSWAVDTLSQVGGLPSALVVAFPGAGSGFLRAEVLDSSGMWDHGPWFDFEKPGWADSALVTARWDGEPAWRGRGWIRTGGRVTAFRGGPGAGRLAFSWFGDWDAFYEWLAEDFEAASSASSPGLWEAAIEAGAAGADPRMVVARLRTLVCNSFSIEQPGHPGAWFDVEPADSVLMDRSGDGLELAALFSAVLGRAGIGSRMLLASADTISVPIPSSWRRALLRVDCGTEVLVDPSACLVGAFFIPGASGCRVLDGRSGRPLTLMVPEGADFWREDWRMGADGSFALDLSAGGAGDSIVRRRLAFPETGSIEAAVALWIRTCGVVAQVARVEIPDLFDLAAPVRLRLEGRIFDSLAAGSAARLPLLPVPLEAAERTWTLPEPVRQSSLGAAEGRILRDTSSVRGPLVRL